MRASSLARIRNIANGTNRPKEDVMGILPSPLTAVIMQRQATITIGRRREVMNILETGHTNNLNNLELDTFAADEEILTCG